jgi:hypothetical protein
MHPERLDAEQLKHLAIVARACYGSYDVALRCLLLLLEMRSAVRDGIQASYLPALGAP